MELRRVENPDAFDNHPEAGMGYHIATSDFQELFVVLSSLVAIPITSEMSFPDEAYQGLEWHNPKFGIQDRIDMFKAWLKDLKPATALTPSSQRLSSPVLPSGPLPAPPPPSSSIYGHLPFITYTDKKDVFYRWEAFPISRRINNNSRPNSIAAGTFAAPASEFPFVPTGFSAVGRYALPSLLPATYRWELQPIPGKIECGACVPLYGQSGGGVEVMFPGKVMNRCPIADPVILPAL